MPVAFLDMSTAEILVVGIVALLVFGGELPQVLRTLGRSYAKLRQSLHEVARPVREEIRRVGDLGNQGLPPNPPYPPVTPPSVSPREAKTVSPAIRPAHPPVTPPAATHPSGFDEPPPV
jgi:sec-independent protein translocase protein TatA